MKSFQTTIALLFALTASTYTLAADTAAANMNPAEKAKIESVVHDYILHNPEVLVEALQILQRKQYEQAEQTVKQTQQTAASFAQPLFHTANDPMGGNPNGKITIVEFFDYQCPHCIDMAPVMDSIIKANPDVRVVYKEFPIRGPLSVFTARATLAANKQGKYNQLSQAILTSNKPLSNALVFELAKSVGIDVAKMKKDMDDKSVDNQIKATTKLAQDLKLFGTPAFFIGATDGNNTPINYFPGQMNQAQLQTAIDKVTKS